MTRLARWPKGRRHNHKKERRRKILCTKFGPILRREDVEDPNIFTVKIIIHEVTED